MSNDHDGSAVITAQNMAPGGTLTRTVTITNTGSVPFALSLVMNPSTNALSEELALTVVEEPNPTSAHDVTLYQGSLAAAGTLTNFEDFAAGQTTTFSFTLALPASAGNGYQDATATLDLLWGGDQIP